MAESATKFQRLLKELVARDYPSVRRAARAAGVAHTTVYDLINGMVDPSPRTLYALESAFKDGARLWEAAGIPRLTDCPPYCEAANAIAAKLGVTKDEAIARALEHFASGL